MAMLAALAPNRCSDVTFPFKNHHLVEGIKKATKTPFLPLPAGKRPSWPVLTAI